LDWFKNWFDSFYYHKLYRHRNTAEAQEFIDNILNYIQPKPKSRILDLACGKGRHSIYLNKKGYDVVGVDLSQNSIDEANKSSNKSLHFFQMDMRELSCDEPYNVVVNLFTSFGYFTDKNDNLKVLKGLHNILEPKGVLIIDFLNASKVINNLVKEEIQKIDSVKFTINRFVEDQTIVKTIAVRDGNERYKFQERVSMFELADFEDMFAKSGFKLMAHFGNYQLNTFDPDSSDRLILIAQKAG